MQNGYFLSDDYNDDDDDDDYNKGGKDDNNKYNHNEDVHNKGNHMSNSFNLFLVVEFMCAVIVNTPKPRTRKFVFKTNKQFF